MLLPVIMGRHFFVRMKPEDRWSLPPFFWKEQHIFIQGFILHGLHNVFNVKISFGSHSYTVPGLYDRLLNWTIFCFFHILNVHHRFVQNRATHISLQPSSGESQQNTCSQIYNYHFSCFKYNLFFSALLSLKHKPDAACKNHKEHTNVFMRKPSLIYFNVLKKNLFVFVITGVPILQLDQQPPLYITK